MSSVVGWVCHCLCFIPVPTLTVFFCLYCLKKNARIACEQPYLVAISVIEIIYNAPLQLDLVCEGSSESLKLCHGIEEAVRQAQMPSYFNCLHCPCIMHESTTKLSAMKPTHNLYSLTKFSRPYHLTHCARTLATYFPSCFSVNLGRSRTVSI